MSPKKNLMDARLFAAAMRLLVAALAVTKVGRLPLNWCYRRLGSDSRKQIHAQFAKIFRRRHWPIQEGEWTFSFLGRTIRLPLRKNNIWLDWDAALSILGNDIEVKVTYERLLVSRHRPKLFIDAGANNGTHSVLFLAAGVPTISIEPNPLCSDWFNATCALNGLKSQWRAVALGGRNGITRLAFPERETWLGTTTPTIQGELSNYNRLSWIDVPMKRLDDLIDFVDPGTTLIKIDVEGGELALLEGATEFISHGRPLIIFENNHIARASLFVFLTRFSYRIFNLPWNSDQGSSGTLDKADFEKSRGTNFIAVWCEFS